MATNRKKFRFGAGARRIRIRSRRLSPRSRARTGIGAGKRPYNYNKRVVSLPKKNSLIANTATGYATGGRSRRLGKVPGTLPKQGIECAGVIDQCGVCNGDGSICESGCGSACGCGGHADCNGNCWMGGGAAGSYFDEYIGDGICQNGLDGGPNLNCAMYNYDGGDCRPSGRGFQRGERVRRRR